jgi:uncharacterized protein YkwD
MKIYSVKIIAACCGALIALSSLAACDFKAPSLVLGKESTTKAEFDEEAFRAEFERTSVPESEVSTAPDTLPASESTLPAGEGTTGAEGETQEESASAAESLSETASEVASSLTQAVTKVTTTKKTVVDTKIDKKETKSEYKYGVKKIDVVSTYYDIYSDGSKVQTDKKTYTKYDYSGYKAATGDLKAEAGTNQMKYATQTAAAVAAVNAVRTAQGKEPLSVDSSLSTAANVRAVEMAYSGKVGSTRPNKSGYSTVLTELGFSVSKPMELTCKGYSDGASAVGAVKSGAGIDRMTDGNYKKIGVGAAANPEGTIYWSIFFSE